MMPQPALRAPFPWFGGKSRIARVVWQRFGVVRNYVEPFFGSGAVLLGRPAPFAGVETVNDKDGLLCNFWRALKHAPEDVALWADWPVNEADLHARHAWLVTQREPLTERLMGDPDFFDTKAAGWWVWGACAWIGSGWCSGEGPWRVVDGVLVNVGDAGQGINRKLPHVGDAGRGINRQLPHVGDAGQGINRKLPHVGDAGRGINRQLPHVGNAGRGIGRVLAHLQPVAERLRDVRVACGEWSRVLGDSVTWRHGTTAVFLDPPYTEGALDYAIGGAGGPVAAAARAWAVENGDNPSLRIALCGYEGEHEMPAGWTCLEWKARGGYGNQGGDDAGDNRHRERIWFSPACINPLEAQPQLSLLP